MKAPAVGVAALLATVVATASAQNETPQAKCGPSYGNQICPSSQCCGFTTGNCGTGPDFCRMPDTCLPEFGRCDSDDNPLPGTHNTSSDARRTDIPFDIITQCKSADMIALTYDDGPTVSTPQILDVLRQNGNAKATFFISGHNNAKTPIDQDSNWVQLIKQIEAEGHQVASHTWTHQNQDKISSNERKNEMWKNEMAISNILEGRFPTYMRPPYIACSETSGCGGDMRALGYRIIDWTVDSGDWEGLGLDRMKLNIDNGFDQNVHKTGMIIIQHETHPESAIELTRYILEKARSEQLRPVTVGECLGDPEEKWYIRTSSSTSRTRREAPLLRRINL